MVNPLKVYIEMCVTNLNLICIKDKRHEPIRSTYVQLRKFILRNKPTNAFLVNKINRCTEFQFYWYFIRKESATMHGHTILKFNKCLSIKYVLSYIIHREVSVASAAPSGCHTRIQTIQKCVPYSCIKLTCDHIENLTHSLRRWAVPLTQIGSLLYSQCSCKAKAIETCW